VTVKKYIIFLDIVSTWLLCLLGSWRYKCNILCILQIIININFCPSVYLRHTNEELNTPTPSSSFWHPNSLFKCILILKLNSCEKSYANK